MLTGTIYPGDETTLAEAVAEASGSATPLAIVGGGTRSGFGRPVQAAAELTTREITGVTLYEPSELVLSARAGTPLAEVEALLAASGQRLAFEPPDYRGLYGSDGAPTIGAVAAANLSGPRRVNIGAARDGLIGLRAVNGRGEVIQTGGRVMKNVTGLDLVKFLAGSYGTLAVLSEVTFKVLPIPETEATLVLEGLDDGTAIAALSAALATPFEVNGAAHRPAISDTPARTWVRIEGFAGQVAERGRRLASALQRYGEPAIEPAERSAEIWRQVRDLAALDPRGDDAVWRLSVRPSDGPIAAATIAKSLDARLLYDWAGGRVWVAVPATGDTGARVIRQAVTAVGGHATLVRAPDPLRAEIDVFQPPAPPLMDLTRKLKASFDPAGILNPGRMYRGV